MSFYFSLHLVSSDAFSRFSFDSGRKKNRRRREYCQKKWECVFRLLHSAQRFSWIFCSFCFNPFRFVLLIFGCCCHCCCCYCSSLYLRYSAVHLIFIHVLFGGFLSRVSSHQIARISACETVFCLKQNTFSRFCWSLITSPLSLLSWLISWWLWFAYVSTQSAGIQKNIIKCNFLNAKSCTSNKSRKSSNFHHQKASNEWNGKHTNHIAANCINIACVWESEN